MTQNCDVVKAENRDTILGGVARFSWRRMYGWFLLKAKSWRDLCRRDAISG